MTPTEIDRICDGGSLKIVSNDKSGDGLVKFISFAKDSSGGRVPIVSDCSKPFQRSKSIISLLDDKSVFRIVKEWKMSFSTRTNMTEVLDSFVDEYCKPAGDLVGAVWFSEHSPSIRQFDDVRNGFGNILAYDSVIHDACEKLNQKNMPYDQSYHIVKDALSMMSGMIGSDVVKMVFVPCSLGKGPVDAMKHLGWLVMEWDGNDFVASR